MTRKQKTVGPLIKNSVLNKKKAPLTSAGAGLEAVRAIAPHFFDQCSPLRPIWATRCTVYAQNFADVDEAHEDRNHDGDAFSVTAIW